MIRLPRPRTAYDSRPELWEVDDRTYLVHLPYVVTSRLLDHGPGEGEYVCTTRRRRYAFDWAPTVCRRTRADLAWARTSLSDERSPKESRGDVERVVPPRGSPGES